MSPQTTVGGEDRSYSLKWQSKHAKITSLDHGIGLVPSNGTREVFPDKTTSYTITAVGRGGRAASTQATVTVPPAPLPAITLEAEPELAAAGAAVKLSWTSQHAAAVWLDHGIGPVPAAGAREVFPVKTTTYRVTAESKDGARVAASATVKVTPQPDPKVQLTAEPEVTVRGQPVTLNWGSQHAAWVSIDHGIGRVPASGSQVVYPERTTRYTIRAGNEDGRIDETSVGITLPAAPAPTVTLRADPRVTAPGGKVMLHWESEGATSVRLSPAIGVVPRRGSYPTYPTKSTTYLITAQGAEGQTSSDLAGVTVRSLPGPTVTLDADTDTVSANEPVSLTWKSEDGVRAWFNQGIGAVALQGSRRVFPGRTANYVITVEGVGGTSTTAAVRVTVESHEPEPHEFRELLDHIDELPDTKKFLIATLPDPFDSHLPREFDLYLSSVSRGLESKGYVRDRFWFPWTTKADRGPAAPDVADLLTESLESSFPEALSKLASLSNIHRRVPGCVLFRSIREDVKEYIVVFVVGETPSRGIQSRAMQRALSLVGARLSHSDTIRIVGPSFSGSSRSLGDILERESSESDRCFLVLSGAASVHQVNKKEIERSVDIRYDSIAADSGVRIKALRKILAEQLGVPAEDVVMLVESSGYGEGAVPSRHGAQTPEGEDDSGTSKEGLLIIPFPMHISRVRAAYATEAIEQERLGISNGVGSSRRDRLRARLADSGSPGDTVPLFGDSSFSPQTFDMVVGEILAKIDRRKDMAIGIVATNVKDKLFLAREIHKHAPNVRLFTVGGDIMLAHPEYVSATRGMIVASSNSMFFNDCGLVANCESNDPPGRRTQYHFPSDGAHGVFKAAQRLLSDDPLAGLPEDRRIWLSVVGREALLNLDYCTYKDPGSTITCLSDQDADRGLLGLFRRPAGENGATLVRIPSEEYDQPPLPRGWIATSLAILLSVFLVWRTSGFRNATQRVSISDRARVYTLPLLCTASVLSMIVVSPLFREVLGSTEGVVMSLQIPDLGSATGLLFSLPLLVFLFALLVAIKRTTEETFGTGNNRWAKIVIYAPAATFLFICSEVLLRLNGGSTLQFSADRLLALASGVSPAIPLFAFSTLAAAWILIAIFRANTHTRLEELADKVHQTAASENGDSKEKPPSIDLKQRAQILDPLAVGAWKQWAKDAHALSWIGGGLVVSWIYLVLYFPDRSWRLLRSLEGGLFDRLLLFLFPFVLLTILESLHFSWKASELVMEILPDAPRPLQDAETAVRKLIPYGVGYATFASAALLLTVTFYPFQPARFLTVYVGIVVAASALFGAYVLIRKLGKDLEEAGRTRMWVDVAGRGSVAVAAPLLSFVVSLIPGGGEFFGSLMEPMLNLLR